MRLSFSPASMYAPSSRMLSQARLKRGSSWERNASSQANVRQPASRYNSANESRVPEVGGGPSTSILVAGRDLFTSFQVMKGFGTSALGFAGSGTFLASARYTSLRDRTSEAPVLFSAMT